MACDERMRQAMELINEVIYIAANRTKYTTVARLMKMFHEKKSRVELHLRKLTAEGILEHKVSYGVRLLKRPEDVTVSDILDTVGYVIEPLPCTDFFGLKECPSREFCMIRPFVNLINHGVRHVCDSYTLADVMKLT